MAERKKEMSFYDLNKMVVHERVWVDSIGIDVLKVPNGWIYSCYDSEQQTLVNSVFVPQT